MGMFSAEELKKMKCVAFAKGPVLPSFSDSCVSRVQSKRCGQMRSVSEQHSRSLSGEMLLETREEGAEGTDGLRGSRRMAPIPRKAMKEVGKNNLKTYTMCLVLNRSHLVPKSLR